MLEDASINHKTRKPTKGAKNLSPNCLLWSGIATTQSISLQNVGIPTDHTPLVIYELLSQLYCWNTLMRIPSF
ncbi:hypothetical protein D1609_01690 [Leptospira borgpetersenii serovar Hardjo-bovis]|nr:hypothetical protein D1609_01690 [Leptospira borgpetersenii serovar Hardjo-bovis]TQE55419.1 hypothetical protein FFZ95_00250 [Leptospira borgpetersenii]TQE58750.1 hypothetical protein FFZ96_02885 [Leptospira borgpetersenii]